MADKSIETIGFWGIGSILLGAVSLFAGGLLSVFVGFMAVASGFFGVKKHQVFSQIGMILGAVALIFFNIVSMGIVQTPLSHATGREHLANSIYASINAFDILKNGELDDDENKKLISYFENGLEQAELVNIEKIDSQIPEFSFHYKNEFINGMKLLIEGYEKDDMLKKLQGGVLLDKWAIWNKENNQKLDKIKDPSFSLISFVKGIITN